MLPTPKKYTLVAGAASIYLSLPIWYNSSVLCQERPMGKGRNLC